MSHRPLKAIILGAMLGASLSCIGFTDFDEVNKMFRFIDLRMFFVFVGGVVLTAIGLRLVPAARTLPRRVFSPGIVIGSILFGIGWALCGACPGVVAAQLGEGRLPALASLAGVYVGILGAGFIQRRVLWDTGSC